MPRPPIHPHSTPSEGGRVEVGKLQESGRDSLQKWSFALQVPIVSITTFTPVRDAEAKSAALMGEKPFDVSL